MGMRLQDAIDFATVPANSQPFGLDTYVVVTMHDERDTVLVGTALTTATFRSNLPLQNWGTATINKPSSYASKWFNRSFRYRISRAWISISEAWPRAPPSG